jgi:hypothetical protein
MPARDEVALTVCGALGSAEWMPWLRGWQITAFLSLLILSVLAAAQPD